ncbi:hypothetical protein J437_LFUL013678 [Ladona fulva]|uniref:Uncharacterized protein n=1 Tax=Ladona fulva TaxID=123851 RepID=A0A8K0KF06_LADFU|nr:hypothetical protein J437_LFUL013678 [Ladona fulva]
MEPAKESTCQQTSLHGHQDPTQEQVPRFRYHNGGNQPSNGHKTCPPAPARGCACCLGLKAVNEPAEMASLVEDLEGHLDLLKLLQCQGSGDQVDPTDFPDQTSNSGNKSNDDGSDNSVNSDELVSGFLIGLPTKDKPKVVIPSLSETQVLHPVLPFPFDCVQFSVLSLMLLGADLPKPTNAPFIYLKSRPTPELVQVLNILKAQQVIQKCNQIMCLSSKCNSQSLRPSLPDIGFVTMDIALQEPKIFSP